MAPVMNRDLVKRSRGVGFVVLIILAVMIFQAPLADSYVSDRGCGDQKGALLQSKRNEGGIEWRLHAKVRGIGGECGSWFFEVELAPAIGRRGAWRWGWQIPTGGHLSRRFGLAAAEEQTEGGRVFGGITSAATRTLVAKTTTGHTIKLSPRLPRRHKRPRWLRNVRTFLMFGPDGVSLREVIGYDRSGLRLFRVKSEEGQYRANRSLLRS